MKSTKRTPLAAACCLTMILLAGCAGLSLTAARQETLDQRVKNYMQAQIDGQWDQAYSFFHSSYRRKVSKENYVHQTRKISYKGFAIEEIAMLPSGDEAAVKVRIDISFMGYVFPRAPQKQIWAKENGGWFVKWSEKTTSQTTPVPRQQKQQ
ncbi:MAG: hypothetical protein JXL20_02465 [Deltaproteobacteria bacterium]|nr:hypothetical protein [Deltaproteobacteria bacterium]